MDLPQRRHECAAHAPPGVDRGVIGLVIAPAERTGATVGGGLLTRERQQRAHERPISRAHAEQRAPARRRRQPVEDRLHLIGRGVPGGDVGTSGERELGGNAVAL